MKDEGALEISLKMSDEPDRNFFSKNNVIRHRVDVNHCY